MALSNVDDLSDIFFGDASAASDVGPACDSCDNRDKPVMARGCVQSDVLRHPATSCDIKPDGGAAVADVAACRSLPNQRKSEQRCGFAQMSQMSQSPDAHSAVLAGAGVALADVGLAQAPKGLQALRFAERCARLLRWGWSQDQAWAMAERLARRDVSADDMESCTECAHYWPGRCGNQCAGLLGTEVGPDLACMLQRCPRFEP